MHFSDQSITAFMKGLTNMKVLWLCGVVLPHLCDEFGFKKTVINGWINSMLEYIHNNSDIKMGICCPIRNIEKMKDGTLNKEQYYSFQMISEGTINQEQDKRFIEIIKDFTPDVIHIWGTEYMHTYNMLCAAEKMGILNRTVVSIQGLISSVVKHYCDGIERDQSGTFEAIRELSLKDKIRSEYEIKAIRKCINISGRTEWDRACLAQINSNAKYWHIGENLRNIFYKEMGKWAVQKCHRHTIFLSHMYCPIKGLHYFLEAFQYVLQKYPDVIVRIAGNNIMESDDAYGRYIKKIASEFKIEKNMQFLGKISGEKMCQEYLDAHVFICPSTVENSSNSVCEAMLVGVPTIGAFVGGIPSLITHKQDGFLYQCNEPEMLAYYVGKIFDDDALAMKISNKAVLSISEKVDKQRNGKALMDLYYKIANE